MGLLGDYDPDPLSQGLLGLGAALMTPRALGGGIGAGFTAFNQGMMQANALKRQMAQDEMRKKLFDMQLAEATESIEEKKRARRKEALIQEAALGAVVPDPGSLGGGVAPGSQQGRQLLKDSLTGDPEFDADMLSRLNPALNSVGPKEAVKAPSTRFDQRAFITGLQSRGMPLEAARFEKESRVTPVVVKGSLVNPVDGTVIYKTNDRDIKSGLVPQIGRNPLTGKWDTFVQDDTGNTKWLGIEPRPDTQFVPGNDYTPPQVFDRRNGNISYPSITPNGAPAGAPSVVATSRAESSPVEPADQYAPWKGLPPRRADDVRIRVGDQVRKQLDEERAALREEAGKIDAMQRFGVLNRQTSTGGILDSLPNFAVPNDTVEMRALTAKLAPRERTPGSGSSSDRDTALFIAAVPSVDKPGPVNKAIRQVRDLAYRRSSEYLNEKEAYFAKMGHVEGFDRVWDEYTKKVPLFATDATDQNFKINPTYQSFAEWSKKGSQAPAAADRTMTEQDIVETMKKSGRSRDEVINAARAKGFAINSPFAR